MYNYRQYSFSFQKSLSYPIRVALFERSLSLPMVVVELNKKGLKGKYTANGIRQIFIGNNISNIGTFHLSNIYEHLNLPQPTPQYLYDSWLRWEEIKKFKKERRNANRVKRGQEPIP